MEYAPPTTLKDVTMNASHDLFGLAVLSISDVLLLMMISGVLGILLFGLIKAFHETDGDDQAFEKQRKDSQKNKGRRTINRLDARGWTLVVDGSNFARHGDPQLEHLRQVLRKLRYRFKGAKLRVFCDANLRYQFDNIDRKRFVRLVEKDDDRFTETHDRCADDVILEYAQDNPRCIVVSNDWFGKGDEIEKRQQIPLLRVDFTRSGKARLYRNVYIFRNPLRPHSKTSIPVARLLQSH
jgi:rRNA-processing protein FCF1